VRILPSCRPDFVMTRARVAVFVEGAFWHGWRFPTWSGKLQPFWRDKIAGNRARDRRNHRTLRRRGWTVLRIWDHQVEDRLPLLVERIRVLTRSSRACPTTRLQTSRNRLRRRGPHSVV